MDLLNTTKLPVIIIAILLVACSSADEAQRKFEDNAFRSPRNITETNNAGDVISEDPDDWRTSPLFAGFVDVFPAFPNPTTGQTVTIELFVTGIGSVNGLEVFRIDDRGRFRSLYFDERSPLPVGFSQIIINPIQFSESGTISGARGLHRVFIFDRRENLISYGDILVE